MSAMTPLAEWRALVSEGPAVVMMARDDAVGLLDRCATAEALLRDFAGLSPHHPPGGVEKAAWARAVDTARRLTGPTTTDRKGATE